MQPAVSNDSNDAMVKPNDLAKLTKAESRFLELEKLLADASVVSNQNQYQKLAKEFSDLSPMVSLYREYQNSLRQRNELDELIIQKHERDFEELAKQELVDLNEKLKRLSRELEELLNPRFHEPDRDVIIEIRAGTGGLEASLFAGDLYRMYTKYGALKDWVIDLISYSESEAGGVKEVIFSVSGKEASKRLKWESGVHRVQRVPTTESSGRIHTSAATVAVLNEPEKIEITIDPQDIEIDTFRSSGPGGQSVNTTDSAVRITHKASGMVVVCQDERSQLKNRAKAMRVLRARLLDKMKQEAFDKEARTRKDQVGSGDRGDKIRTYNFPDRRITDHRIGYTTHQLEKVLDGNLDELTEALLTAEREAAEKAAA